MSKADPCPKSAVSHGVGVAGLVGLAVWTLVAVGNSTFAIGLAVLAIGYYAASYDRLKWLLQTGAEGEE